ncbi:MAG TPA: hypothetical protein VIJ42_12690 [Stellaceae bacterium]
MNRVNVLCTFWGTRYSKDLVNNLYRSVQLHLHREFNFYCCTDEIDGFDGGIKLINIPEVPIAIVKSKRRWPNVYLKLLLTKDGFGGLVGPTLVLDIDLLITGDIDCFFDYRPSEFCIIQNWTPRRHEFANGRPNIGNSSVFRFDAGKSNFVAQTFLSEIDDALDDSKFNTEQAFLTYAMRRVVWWPDSWVRSWKRHCRPVFPLNLILQPQFPGDCRMLVFHGSPDIDEAIEGYNGKRLHHRSRPAPWLRQYYLG